MAIPKAREDPHPTNRERRRIGIASSIGTLVEAFDYSIYGVAAALVFPQTFFPALGHAAGVVASIASFGITFALRPLGAVLFGHIGDRYGRRITLIITITAMGLTTGLMGVIPSAHTIGIAAPILIIVLRALAGLAYGGEWAGALLLSTEHAPRRRRGLYAAFPQLGNSGGNILSPATLLAVSLLVGTDNFAAWGWRVAFIFCGSIAAIALYVRLKVDETPAFKETVTHTKVLRVPLVETFRHQCGVTLRAAGVLLPTFALLYTSVTYLPSYAVDNIGLSQNQVLFSTVIATIVYAAATTWSAVFSDKLDRRLLAGGAAVVGTVWMLLFFPILRAGHDLVTFTLAMCVSLAVAGLVFGSAAALIAEQFSARYRFTATSISYNLCAVAGGGVVPVMAPLVLGSSGPIALGIMLAVVCLIAAGCTFSLPNKMNSSMNE